MLETFVFRGCSDVRTHALIQTSNRMLLLLIPSLICAAFILCACTLAGVSDARSHADQSDCSPPVISIQNRLLRSQTAIASIPL